ncbi:MAG TPA: hypothetical protein PLX72_05795 [Candidatus Syntrophosphaera sp.]|nr:hypothetical protein [Candidatus Syntrophosphaera sp.]
MRLKNLNPVERRTAILLVLAALFNGVILSLNQTQDIIARKALHAKDWQLMLMTMIWPVANFLRPLRNTKESSFPGSTL